VPLCRALLAVLLGAPLAVAQPPKPAPPVAADPRLVVTRFAAAPDIVHPIAADFDAKGRLLVVESHSHFRPAKYNGPKFDRIRVIADTNGDGTADTFTTFAEGFTATMDLAVAPDGSVYVATRNEILRLRDTNSDGTADEQQRLIFLDTKGNYPHNGLCGLCFDSKGNLNFGMGENLGEPYTLIGADGTWLAGGGEGGNVYHCTADGKKLRRVATGFWNPFGACRDSSGRLLVVDNDPDASPPCRMLHVVEGGDYGFQFRYGRAGRHPFQAWNGELPGTLPMVAGTGESPCEVVCYTSAGLPAEYRGELLVPAWADHRVERYTLKPKGASVTAERKPFIQGGTDFYPSGLAVAPDGSLFVTDWGSKSYELHGKGAIWHIRWKDAKPTKPVAKPKPAPEPPPPPLPDDATLLPHFADPDPFVRHAAVQKLAGKPELVKSLDLKELTSPQQRLGLLLTEKTIGRTNRLAAYLADADADVRFLAIKWVSDDRLTEFRPHLLQLLQKPNLDPREFVGLSTALARLDGQPVTDSALADYFVARLADPQTPAGTRLLALRSIPATHGQLKTEHLVGFLKHENPAFRIEALRALKDRGDAKAAAAVEAVARDEQQPVAVRAQALVTLAAMNHRTVAYTDFLIGLVAGKDSALQQEALRSLVGVKLAPQQMDRLKGLPVPALPPGGRGALARLNGQPIHDPRPDTKALDAWLKFLDGPADPEAGRRVFEHSQLAGCFKCHRVEGRGANVGPDLSLIGRTERKWILESLLQPSAVVAPHYQAWTIRTTDDRTLTGLLVRTYLDESEYIDENGNRFVVRATEVESITAAKTSIMPEGLLTGLTDQEIRDLLAYLASRQAIGQ
jgi:putative membrane-bound dehydrogenase-like protein